MKTNFVFFGTSRFAVIVLETLHTLGLIPSMIVTTPDKPQGRKLEILPTPAKVWALAHNIQVLQPEKLNEEFKNILVQTYSGADLYIVASYGKIIPEIIFNIPKHKTLNIHPSLLPKLRGATPIEGAILHEEKTGVTIMQIDKEMDHGPIVAQKRIHVDPWPPRADHLEEVLATEGARLLASIIPDWIDGKITAIEQAHNHATFTKKITKEDGELDLSADPFENWKKIQAYYGWPGSFYFVENDGKKMRIKISQARFEPESKKLIIEKVIPEGKKEVNYSDLTI